MKNCIFSPICHFAQCTNEGNLYEQEFNINNNDRVAVRKLFSKSNGNYYDCGVVCPMWNLSSILLKTNKLEGTNIFSKMTPVLSEECRKLFDKVSIEGSTLCYCIPRKVNLNDAASLLTYYGVCATWRFSVRWTPIYHLNLLSYIDREKGSWGLDVQDINNELLFERNMINSKFEGSNHANYLVVSGLEYINFKEYESNILLKIIGTRTSHNLPTIIVGPELSSLMGNGPVFNRITGILQDAKESCL